MSENLEPKPLPEELAELTPEQNAEELAEMGIAPRELANLMMGAGFLVENSGWLCGRIIDGEPVIDQYDDT